MPGVFVVPSTPMPLLNAVGIEQQFRLGPTQNWMSLLEAHDSNKAMDPLVASFIDCPHTPYVYPHHLCAKRDIEVRWYILKYV